MANQDLINARKAKKDEFYTQLVDIEKELHHYRDYFRGKTVLCNCDDPYESNFFKFFALNFNSWGLKKLITTCYDGSPVAGTELLRQLDSTADWSHKLRTAHKLVITEVPDLNGDGATDLTDVDLLIQSDKNVLTRLEGNGDFRSAECTDMLGEADIVVTNPPFSLFREYVAQLMTYEKDFVIIGNLNALTYKEIFPLFKDNRIWLGPSITSGDRKFRVPDSYPLKAANCGIDDDGHKFVRVKGVRWFTNLDHKRRHEPLILYKRYVPEEYPAYDNYKAINVDKTVEIPMDYEGVMGVPITFLDKYCPEQFEILDANDYRRTESVPCKAHGLIKDKDGSICGKNKYARILIRKK